MMDVPKADRLEYIHTMLRELHSLASDAPMLAYLLEMAFAEAGDAMRGRETESRQRLDGIHPGKNFRVVIGAEEGPSQQHDDNDGFPSLADQQDYGGDDVGSVHSHARYANPAKGQLIGSLKLQIHQWRSPNKQKRFIQSNV